jgi:MFS family permease
MCIILYLVCVGLPSAATYDVVFSVYGSLTALSFFLMLRVDNMGDTGSRVLDTTAVLKESTSAISLVYSDVRLLLIIPFQLCVGLAFSFVPFYVFGTIIADSDNLGSAYVGLISATIPLTGSAMAFPTAAVASKYGKVLPMTIGAIGLGMAGLAVIIFSDETLGTWEFVMVYIVVYGIGRGVYENTNKAVVVDFFSHGRNTCSDAKRGDITAAFAATNFARNIASAFGYFAFNHISRLEMSLLVFVFAIVGLLCYYAAHLTNQSQLALQSQSEHSSHHASPLLSSNQESSSTTHHASGQVDQ